MGLPKLKPATQLPSSPEGSAAPLDLLEGIRPVILNPFLRFLVTVSPSPNAIDAEGHRRGYPASLTRQLRDAVRLAKQSPSVWERLTSSIPPAEQQFVFAKQPPALTGLAAIREEMQLRLGDFVLDTNELPFFCREFSVVDRPADAISDPDPQVVPHLTSFDGDGTYEPLKGHSEPIELHPEYWPHRLFFVDNLEVDTAQLVNFANHQAVLQTGSSGEKLKLPVTSLAIHLEGDNAFILNSRLMALRFPHERFPMICKVIGLRQVIDSGSPGRVDEIRIIFRRDIVTVRPEIEPGLGWVIFTRTWRVWNGSETTRLRLIARYQINTDYSVTSKEEAQLNLNMPTAPTNESAVTRCFDEANRFARLLSKTPDDYAPLYLERLAGTSLIAVPPKHLGDLFIQ